MITLRKPALHLFSVYKGKTFDINKDEYIGEVDFMGVLDLKAQVKEQKLEGYYIHEIIIEPSTYEPADLFLVPTIKGKLVRRSVDGTLKVLDVKSKLDDFTDMMFKLI